jgi:hypothetical protein
VRGIVATIAVVVLAACGASSNAAQPPHTTSTAAATAATTTTTIAPRVVHRPRPHHVGSVTAIGDSTMLDAAPSLRALIPHVRIDAAVSRSALPAPRILAYLAAAHVLGSEIVFALGTNGGISATLLDNVLNVADGRRVVMVTNHCTHCGVSTHNNMLIYAGCRATRHCFVADWNAIANAHPSWFAPDGVHMTIGGIAAAAFARLVRSKL